MKMIQWSTRGQVATIKISNIPVYITSSIHDVELR